MDIRAKIRILHVFSSYHKCEEEKNNNAVKFSQLFCVLRNFTFLAGKKSVHVFLMGGHSGTAFYETLISVS